MSIEMENKPRKFLQNVRKNMKRILLMRDEDETHQVEIEKHQFKQMQPPTKVKEAGNKQTEANVQDTRNSRPEDGKSEEVSEEMNTEEGRVKLGSQYFEEEIEQVEMEEKPIVRKKRTSLTSSFKKRFRYPSRKFSLDASTSQPTQVPAEFSNPGASCMYSSRFSMDCASCMLVEMGEKASYLGQPCDNCGKVPRTPYELW